jgi:hypothetical protein
MVFSPRPTAPLHFPSQRIADVASIHTILTSLGQPAIPTNVVVQTAGADKAVCIAGWDANLDMGDAMKTGADEAGTPIKGSSV